MAEAGVATALVVDNKEDSGNTNARPPVNADGANDLRLIRTRKGHTLTFDDVRRAGCSSN